MRSTAAAALGRSPGRLALPPPRCARPVVPRPAARVAAAAPSDDPLAALGLAPPPLDGDLESLQAAAGVEEVGVDGGASTSAAAAASAATFTSFGADAAAAAALKSEAGVALVDAGGWTVLRLAGPGALPLLHAQSTADFAGRDPAPAPGAAIPTAFTTPAGGCLGAGTALVLPGGGGVLLLLGPGGPPGQVDGGKVGGAAVARRLAVAASLPPATPAEEVAVADVTPRTAVFSLLGPGAAAALARLGARAAAEQPAGAFTMLGSGGGGGGGGGAAAAAAGGAGAPIFVVAGCGLASVPGFTLLADRDSGGAADLWAALSAVSGVIPAGSALWHAVRVEDGAPAVGSELDGRHTPLEAGLGRAWVSVAKGCYLGAEALTKAAGAKGRLKAELWGLRIAAPAGVRPVPGDAVVVVEEGGGGGEAARGGPPLGRLTSVAPALPGAAGGGGGGTLALAYLSPARAAAAGGGGSPDALKPGLRVRVACTSGSGGGGAGGGPTTLAPAVVEALPHADRAKPPLKAAAAAAAAAAPAAAEPGAGAGAKDKDAARAAKLAAMKARLDAWQAEQAQAGGGGGGGGGGGE